MLLNFFDVTLDHAQLLFDWRNDPVTRENSLSNDLISYEIHVEWLKKSLQNPKRKLFLVKNQNEFVGTVRFDRTEEENTWELSWTIAPTARGQGLGKIMLQETVKLFDFRLTATIKESNIASKKIAQAAGFILTRKNEDITYWCRENLSC